MKEYICKVGECRVIEERLIQHLFSEYAEYGGFLCVIYFDEKENDFCVLFTNEPVEEEEEE